MKPLLLLLAGLALGIVIGRWTADPGAPSAPGPGTSTGSNPIAAAGPNGPPSSPVAPTPSLPSEPPKLTSDTAPSEVEVLLGALRELEPTSIAFTEKLDEAVLTWAKTDPGAAMNFLHQMEPQLPGVSRIAVSNLAEHWAAKDPRAAVDFLKNSSKATDDQRSYGLSSALVEWAKSEPAAAWESYSGTELMNGDYEVRTEILGRWSETDANASAGEIAALVSRGVDEAHLGPMAMRGLLKPANAGEGSPPGAREPVSGDQISRARTWLEGLPADSDTRVAATAGLLGTWVRVEPEAASQWLADQPPSAARNAGIESMIGTVATDDPEAAAIWALELPPGRSQTGNLLRIVSRWQLQDADAAEAFLSKNLDPALAAKVREGFAGRGQQPNR